MNNKIGFTDIPRLIESCMSAYANAARGGKTYGLSEALAADQFARDRILKGYS